MTWRGRSDRHPLPALLDVAAELRGVERELRSVPLGPAACLAGELLAGGGVGSGGPGRVAGPLPLTVCALAAVLHRVCGWPPYRGQGCGDHGRWLSLPYSHRKWSARVSRELRYLLIGLAGGLCLAGGSAWLLRDQQPRSFDECVLKNVKPGMSDQAASMVYLSCRQVFPQETPAPKTAHPEAAQPAEGASANPCRFSALDYHLHPGEGLPRSLGSHSLDRLTGRAGVLSGGAYFGGSLYNGNRSWRVTQLAVCLVHDSADRREYVIDVDISPQSTGDFRFRFLPGAASSEAPAWSIVHACGKLTAGPEPDDGPEPSLLDRYVTCTSG